MKELFLVFEVTQSCNSRCNFCYNVWKDDSLNYSSDRVLALDDIKKIFSKIEEDLKGADLKIGGITLAGGEPLLHPDIIQIASIVKSHGIRINIATNGILLTREKIDKFKELGINSFEISLPSAKNYLSVTGVDAFDSVKKAFFNLRSIIPESHITLAFTATKESIKEFRDVMDLAFAFSVNRVVLNRFVPGGEGLKLSDKLIPDIEELKILLKTANLKSRRFSLPVDVAIPVEDCITPHSNYPMLNFGSCLCGHSKWVIDPAGNLRICEQNPEIIGDLKTTSITDLINEKSVKDFRSNNRYEDCIECSCFNSCRGGCRYVID